MRATYEHQPASEVKEVKFFLLTEFGVGRQFASSAAGNCNN